MTKVLIVDDHAMMRDALKQLIDGLDGFETAGELADAAMAPLYCEKLAVQLAVLDVCTAGGSSGIEAAADIRASGADIRLIVMSGFDEITFAPRARAAGADAFVFKSRSLDYFREVLLGVMEGKKFFPEPRTIPVPGGEAPLTEREMEILRLMCRHMTAKEIADELFISENTVKYHRKSMLAKTGFESTVDLAFYMISKGWINPNY